MNRNGLLRLALLIAALFIGLTLAACSGSAPVAQVTPFPTATAQPTTATTDTPTPEPTESPSPAPSATPAATTDPDSTDTSSGASDTPRPTATPPATATPQPTSTPTSVPQFNPTPALNITGSMREGVPTPPTAIPSPVPVFDLPEGTTNILLLGKDQNADGSDARTDTMIIVSINREAQTASMISLPRDLYVYMPNRIMGRLNTAINLGGVELLEQTILYNFGIPIHYHAQVDFDGFKQIVDLLGGVTMAVSCPLQDWRLISPELDPTLEENWEQFKLEAGIHQMDGDLALWYARSRLTTNDFDRGRRQQQLLQAMLNQSVDLGLVAKAPELWSTFHDVVETNMDIGRILQLASMAPAVRDNGVQHLYLAGKMQAWTVPDTGAAVQLPIWEGDGMMYDTFRRLLLPPALNRADRAPITVEIINASQYPAQGLLAADNLAWYGFAPVMGETRAPQATSEMIYFGDNFKGSYDWLFAWVMGMPADNIQLSDADSATNYRVIIGDDYNPCRPAFLAPQEALPEP
ncbi:MAG: LCP family protein [Candidatus Promineofilum sp.]|nr:LCP family protein [Promineifilum sp.]MCW5863576.1 LCP family protein [Anaerolineae bacterium]